MFDLFSLVYDSDRVTTKEKADGTGGDEDDGEKVGILQQGVWF